jgi:hypothetical protein
VFFSILFSEYLMMDKSRNPVISKVIHPLQNFKESRSRRTWCLFGLVHEATSQVNIFQPSGHETQPYRGKCLTGFKFLGDRNFWFDSTLSGSILTP